MLFSYPYAKRLLNAKRPNWTAAKLLCGIFSIFNLIQPKNRKKFYSLQHRCEEEAQSDLKHILWAKELIKKYETANDPV